MKNIFKITPPPLSLMFRGFVAAVALLLASCAKQEPVAPQPAGPEEGKSYFVSYEQALEGMGEWMSTRYEYRDLVHCNWGWGGTANGYFLSGVFDVQQPVQLDDDPTESDYNFRYKVEMLPNIHPE